jgi:hypothetical protein
VCGYKIDVVKKLNDPKNISIIDTRIVIVAFWAENTCQSDNSKEEEKVYRIDLRTSLQIYILKLMAG